MHKNKELERSTEPSEVKTALAFFQKNCAIGNVEENFLKKCSDKELMIWQLAR